MQDWLTYFAYGSNMLPQRLRARTPSCRMVGRATLPLYLLRFHKRGRDGSGKCSVLYTGDPAHRVCGVLYRIRTAEKTLLDDAESLGVGYAQLAVEVEAGELQSAFCYVAAPAYVQDELVPYDWYRALVIAGAAVNGLPAGYLAELKRVGECQDPDRVRAARHYALLDSAPGVEGPQ